MERQFCGIKREYRLKPPVWNLLVVIVLLVGCAKNLLTLLPDFGVNALNAGNTRRKSVVVVGAGVGGLAVASRVASRCGSAVEVTIVEKNEYVGGRCGSFHVEVPGYGSFRHDRGPSLLLLPEIYERLFTDCGSTAAENGIELLKCVPAYQIVFDDGEHISVGFRRSVEGAELCADEKRSRKQMDRLEDNGALKWDAYLKSCEAFLDCGLPNFIEERLDLSSFPSFLRESLRDFGRAWPLKPHSDVLEGFFTSNKMRALASFQDLYVGLEPYRDETKLFGGVMSSTAPAVFGLLSAIELHPTSKKCGVFAPRGGFAAVTQSFMNLAERTGVKVITNASVTRISSSNVEYEKDGKSFDLVADSVVVNADLPYSSKVLVEDTRNASFPRYDWDDSFRLGCGVVAFHWAVGRRLDVLNTHNVFLESENFKRILQSWDVVRKGSAHDFSGPFNFYVHRASAVDSSAAPSVRSCSKCRDVAQLECSHLANFRVVTVSWS